MTWKSHMLVTGIGAYAITLNPEFTTFAVMGSVLPDRLEFLIPSLRHRGNTHALSLWIAAVLLSYLAYQLHPLALPLLAVTIGGLCHVLEDMCSMSGIPLWPHLLKRGRNLKIPIYRTWAPSEYFVTAMATIFFVGIILDRTKPA